MAKRKWQNTGKAAGKRGPPGRIGWPFWPVRKQPSRMGLASFVLIAQTLGIGDDIPMAELLRSRYRELRDAVRSLRQEFSRF